MVGEVTTLGGNLELKDFRDLYLPSLLNYKGEKQVGSHSGQRDYTSLVACFLELQKENNFGVVLKGVCL